MGSKEETNLLKKKARNFFENAESLANKKIFDLAAFNLEQAAQLFLKSFLLEKKGYYPKTHSLRILLSQVAELDERAKKLLEDESLGLALLEDAYITSRYFAREFEIAEIKKLVEVVQKIIQLVG